MISAWRDIDATDAEQQVKNLRRRIVGVEEEILAYRTEFGDFTKLTFAHRLAIQSLTNRRDHLHSALQQLMDLRQREVVNVALNGPEFPRNSASFESLAEILHSVQRLFTSVVQAVTTGPTQRGPIPTYVERAAKLRLAEVYPSSFGMVVELGADENLVVRSALERSLQTTFALFNSSTNGEQLLEKAGSLGTRTMSHYRRLISSLQRTETVPKLEWSDPSGNFNVWTANRESLQAAADAVSSIRTERTEEKVVTGILVGASLLKGTFEVLTEQGDVLEGRIAEHLINSISRAFATRCVAHYTLNETLNRLTGSTKSVVTLTAIGPVPDGSISDGLAVIDGN